MMHLLPRRRCRAGERGVALVEAAVILPFLVLLVIGMLEAGFAFRDGNTLARATQHAARSNARLADNPLADYEALRALQTGLSSLSASSVERVIIYDAGASGDSPPSSCTSIPRPDDETPAGVGGTCNVYSRTQVESDQPGSFGCSSWDQFFCPTNDAHRQRNGDEPTRIGVWVELSYDKVTSVLPGSMSLTRAAVYQLEPCVAGDDTC